MTCAEFPLVLRELVYSLVIAERAENIIFSHYRGIEERLDLRSLARRVERLPVLALVEIHSPEPHQGFVIVRVELDGALRFRAGYRPVKAQRERQRGVGSGEVGRKVDRLSSEFLGVSGVESLVADRGGHQFVER